MQCAVKRNATKVLILGPALLLRSLGAQPSITTSFKTSQSARVTKKMTHTISVPGGLSMLRCIASVLLVVAEVHGSSPRQ